MVARCTNCNKGHSFSNKRGAKLSERKCSECGGKLEFVGGSHTLAGEHPFDSSKTYNDNRFYKSSYFYADKNRSGEYFVWNNGYYYKIENPAFPEKV